MASAFEGVRVIDIAHGLAGSMAAMLLADHGAEVLKIRGADGEAALSPRRIGTDRNKQEVRLDLAVPGDRARFEVLLAAADVLVSDGGPAECARRGLEGAALVERHPRLVALWTPPFGATGQWSELPPHHGMLAGLAGAAMRQGAWSDQPIWHVAPIAHYAQGVLAAAAVGAALFARHATRRGQPVTVSGLHAMAQVACPVAEPGGSVMGRAAPIGSSPSYRLYRCGDGRWLFLGALFSHFFSRAAEALELKGAEIYEPGAAITERLASAPRDHWLGLFRAHDVPAGPVERREDWLRHEICTDNELCARLDHARLGPVEMPGVAARLEATPGRVRHLLQPCSEADLEAFAAPRPTPQPADSADSTPTPLAGVKVLDLGTVIAGTYAASILANFGADVVKVEPPEGDPFRFAMTGFINYNRGKRGLGLDLKAAAGRKTFLDMAAQADVVVDNYRLGVRERLGIDHAAVRAINPRLISCSANTYGSRGAHARLPGFDPLIQAQSGLMAAQGGDSPPVFHTIPVNDVATAALTAFAVIAALNARARTGEGQVVETSLAAASTLYQFEDLVAYEGRPPTQIGCRDCPGFSALDRYYATRDGWLTLGVREPAQFERLAGALGRPEWISRWPGAAALDETRDGDLAMEVGAALLEMSRESALQMLELAGIPATPVLTPREAAGCDALWENGYYEIFSHPQWGELVGSRGYAEFDGASARFARLEPELGEHGAEVLLEYGFERERIVELARQGVIFRG
ncbi:MAG TPA: CoA transferase [Caulobacteraceae bacterium]|jgi:crotonobetainyl-CoA:carnitine CoA-transferase CaiB-like acyl-CoA transferase